MTLGLPFNYGMITSISFSPSKTQIPQDLTYTKTYSHSFKTIRTVIKSFYLIKTVSESLSITMLATITFNNNNYKDINTVSITKQQYIIYKMTYSFIAEYSYTSTFIFGRYLVKYKKKRFTYENMIGIICCSCSIVIIIFYLIYFIIAKKLEPKGLISDDISTDESLSHQYDGVQSSSVNIDNKDDEWI